MRSIYQLIYYITYSLISVETPAIGVENITSLTRKRVAVHVRPALSLKLVPLSETRSEGCEAAQLSDRLLMSLFDIHGKIADKVCGSNSGLCSRTLRHDETNLLFASALSVKKAAREAFERDLLRLSV